MRLVLLFCLLTLTAASFDPYQDNGGLISAVAGRDFVVVACDTRMMRGYEILTRSVANRIWQAEDRSVLVASAGCSADCDQLRRVIRSDLRQAKITVTPKVVATLLSQTLYGRRGFPYYSFCIVGGLGDVGQVYVYDAIGSYEGVAVATSGTGRDLLQPILDRQFKAVDQIGSSKPLKYVDCSKEDALLILEHAYRAVSEREIGVGDELMLCSISRSDDGDIHCETFHRPLKQH